MEKNLNAFRSKRETQKSVRLDRIEKSLKNISELKSRLKQKSKKRKNREIKEIIEKNSIFASEMDVISRSICKLKINSS